MILIFILLLFVFLSAVGIVIDMFKSLAVIILFSIVVVLLYSGLEFIFGEIAIDILFSLFIIFGIFLLYTDYQYRKIKKSQKDIGTNDWVQQHCTSNYYLKQEAMRKELEQQENVEIYLQNIKFEPNPDFNHQTKDDNVTINAKVNIHFIDHDKHK